MTWLPLDSQMFLSVAYDATQRILYLRFRSGDAYRYFQFSEDDYQLFLAADSKGRHFLSHIRDRFPYERLAKLRLAGSSHYGLRRTLTTNPLPPRQLWPS
jgi:KTSC domain-containing protein